MLDAAEFDDSLWRPRWKSRRWAKALAGNPALMEAKYYACPLFRKEFDVKGDDSPGDRLRQRAGHLSALYQRQAGRQRLLHARLDRLQQARLLQHLRRDRADPRQRRQRHRRRAGRRLVLPARSAGSRAQPLRRSAAAVGPTGDRVGRRHASKPSPPTARGRPPLGRTRRRIPGRRNLRRHERRLPAGPRPGSMLRRLAAGGRRRSRSAVPPGRQAPSVPRRYGARDRRAAPGEDHRAEAGRLRLRHGPELRRLRPAEGPRAGRARRSCCALPKCSIPTARSTRPTSARPGPPTPTS